MVTYDDNESSTGVVLIEGDSEMDMASVMGKSMAGISESSGGESIVKLNQSVSQRSGSMYSGSDVQIVRQGGPNESIQDDMNVSMAGLTDMSMGEVKRLDDSEAGNYSMAELSVDDVNESGASGRMGGGKIKSTALPKGNILDALKEEDMQLLKMKEQEDLIEQKRQQLNESVAAF